MQYEQQYKIMGEICSQFEKDGDKDSTFENILELMQKVKKTSFLVLKLSNPFICIMI